MTILVNSLCLLLEKWRDLKVKSLGIYGYGCVSYRRDGNVKQAYVKWRTGITPPYGSDVMDQTAKNEKIANGDYIS
jgi:hypothetical protein